MPGSVADKDQIPTQRVGSSPQQSIDPQRWIQEEELPKVSTSSTQQRGLGNTAKEIDGSDKLPDQAEHPLPDKRIASNISFFRRRSPSHKPFSARLVDSIRSEPLDTVLSAPSPPRIATSPSRQLPPPPAPPPAPSPPVNISTKSISIRSLPLESASPVPPLSPATNVPRQSPVISSLPYSHPASPSFNRDPIPSTSTSTSSEIRPNPTLPSKPISDLPPPIDINTPAVPQSLLATQKRFFSQHSNSEKRPQKRKRLASDGAESGSARGAKGKEREVEMELEEGELPVSDQEKDSKRRAKSGQGARRGPDRSKNGAKSQRGKAKQQKTTRPTEEDSDEDTFLESAYELTLPQLDFSRDSTRPPPFEVLHKTAKKFFEEEKDSLYEWFKKRDSTGKRRKRQIQARQLLATYAAELRETDPSRTDELLRHFAAYEGFCRRKNIETFPIVTAKLALAFYDYEVGTPHLHGQEALLALKEIKAQTWSPWSSSEWYKEANSVASASTAVEKVIRSTRSEMRDVATLEVKPSSLSLREDGKTEQLQPVERPETLQAHHNAIDTSNQSVSTNSTSRSTARKIDLPQPGDIYPSDASLHRHTAISLIVTWGYSAAQATRVNAAEYRCTVGGCNFKIKAAAMTKVDGKTLIGRWKVLDTSTYDHTHDKRDSLVNDPTWRPTLRKEDLVEALKQFDQNGRLDDEDQVKRVSTSQKKVSRFVPDPSVVLIGASSPSLKQSTSIVKRSKYKSASHISSSSSSSSEEESAYSSSSSASPEPDPSPQPPRTSRQPLSLNSARTENRAPSPELSPQSKSKPLSTKSSPDRQTPLSPKLARPATASSERPSRDAEQAIASTSPTRLAEPTIPSNSALPSAPPAITPAVSGPVPQLTQPITLRSASPVPSSSMPPPPLPSSSFFSARRLPPHLVSTISHLLSPLTHVDPLSIPPELLSFISSLSPSSTSPHQIKLIASILLRAGFDSFETITEFVGFERETRGKVWEIVKLEMGEDRESCEVVEGIERRIVEGGEKGWNN